jgi:hypothetical protein
VFRERLGHKDLEAIRVILVTKVFRALLEPKVIKVTKVFRGLLGLKDPKEIRD